jgi:hypothetical protein
MGGGGGGLVWLLGMLLPLPDRGLILAKSSWLMTDTLWDLTGSFESIWRERTLFFGCYF